MQARDITLRYPRCLEETKKMCTNISILSMMLFMGYEKEVKHMLQQALLDPSYFICSLPWGMIYGESSGYLLHFQSLVAHV